MLAAVGDDFDARSGGGSAGARGGGKASVKAAEKSVIVNRPGRGDKDGATAAEWFDLLDKDSAGHEIAKEGEQL